MRLVKQGEGILNLSGEQTYSGPTDLWGGTVNFTGKLPNSRVWMNRFAELNAKADFGKDIKMEYASVLRCQKLIQLLSLVLTRQQLKVLSQLTKH